MKTFLILTLAALSSLSAAQAPDVRIKGDLSLGITSSNDFSIGAKSYTPLGRHSTISLQTTLPIGLRVFLSERVQTIKNDPDDDPFDEYYVEDSGSWRVGKQYIPFGGGGFFRQSVLAARLDSNLLLNGFPISIAFTDGGMGRQYGVAGRLGGRGLGLSFCFGRHWGINSSSMALVQSIQNPEGLGNGWKHAYGLDLNRRAGKFSFRTEGLVLRQAEGTSVDKEVWDTQFSYDLGHRHSALVGFSKVLGDPTAFTRVGGTYNAAKGIQLEAMYRLQDSNFRDFSLFLRVRF
jgi:hypothetical protein